jgi:alkylation response protein AidB-like acyl-CoA dehydrogenase
MNFDFSDKTKDLQRRLQAFMDEHIYPNEQRLESEIERHRWKPAPIIEELKPKARAARKRRWRRLDQSRVCAALRNHGPQPHGSRSL